MKKRILALALAGTTAFSVFGAAMSANALEVWTNGSTHQTANDSNWYYSYVPAGDITWNESEIPGTTVVVNINVLSPSNNLQFEQTVPAGTLLYALPGTKATSNVKDNSAVTELKTGDGIYFADLTAFMKSMNYQTTSMTDGIFKVGTTDCVLYVASGTGDTAIYKTTTKTAFDNMVKSNSIQESARVTGNANIYYQYGANLANDATVYTDLAGSNDKTWTNAVEGVLDSHTAPYVIGNAYAYGTEKATNMKTYAYSDICHVQVPATSAQNTSKITTDSGATILDAVDVDDVTAILDNPVQQSGVVYLYDYYYDETFPSVTDSRFAQAWGNGDLSTVMVDGATINPETGTGLRSIRSSVLLEWEDFLVELGIRDYLDWDKDGDYLTAWAKDTIKNYAYTYYPSSNVITNVTVDNNGDWSVNFGGAVNLYNFDQLIEDILNAATGDNALSLQTSNLVYLMQQYDKFVGEGFVDQNPVEANDWGDLLVSLLQAPTEDEFRTSAAYRQYTARADQLIGSYENAATSVALATAEEAMYDFVTTYQTVYRVSEKADTTVLATALDNTYFNANWAKVGEVYGGAAGDKDGKLDAYEVDSYFSNAWALYPAADYSGTVMTGNYPGVDTPIYSVSSEYFWFYNVYDLAYNVYTDAQFQSVVDLMASTLDDAVDALTPSQSAYASEILGAEEQNDKLENLIDTDYKDAMWANRNKINTYINDRVSNDEIGHVGSKNAATIAQETAKLLGWQMNQTGVTKADINSVSAAKTQAQTALTNLRNDEENYNAAQANALQKAIDECDVIIDLYNGTYSRNKNSQSVNGESNIYVGDKDQILKSDITNAVQGVEDAINFSNIIQGWSQDENGKWMYGTEEGYLNDGWHQVDGGNTWFYFNEDGTAKQSEWWQNPENGYWYWFNSNCGAAVGWAKVDGNWYYFKGDNHMKTGWEKVEGSWYYMDASGKMVTGWCQINGTWYYFSKESNALGQMLANTTTPDGYKVDANGALVE